MEKEIRKDKLTNQEFIPKRKNQKFINATNRINYHNMIARQIREAQAFVVEPLNKNHKILLSLMKDYKTIELYKYGLMELGYNFEAYTHTENINGHYSVELFNFFIINDLDADDIVHVIRKN